VYEDCFEYQSEQSFFFKLRQILLILKLWTNLFLFYYSFVFLTLLFSILNRDKGADMPSQASSQIAKKLREDAQQLKYIQKKAAKMGYQRSRLMQDNP